MEKNERENRLISTALIELQKTQQLADSEQIKHQLKKFINNKQHLDIVQRDDLIKDGRDISEKLTDRIDSRQDALDNIMVEIDTNQTELQASLSIAKQAIAELRKVNPKKANELESSLALKVKDNHAGIVNKKRL